MNFLEIEKKLEMAKIIDIMDGIAESGKTSILRVSKKGGYNLTMGLLKCKGKTIPLLLDDLHDVIRKVNRGVKNG